MKPQHAFNPHIASDILWTSGADTYEIAKMLRVPEHEVYNSMPVWKGSFIPAERKAAA